MTKRLLQLQLEVFYHSWPSWCTNAKLHRQLCNLDLSCYFEEMFMKSKGTKYTLV